MLGLTIVVGLEHGYYLSRTGDLLFRYHGMATHNSKVTRQQLLPNLDQRSTPSGYHSGRSRELLWHWFKAYPSVMLWPNADLGLHSLSTLAIVVPGLFVFCIPGARLLVLWALLPFLYLSFGTTSFSSYTPIPVAPRYIELVYSPLFLLAGAVVDRRFMSKPRGAIVPLCVMVLVGVTGFSCAFSTRGEGWYTDDVKVLRVIVQRAKAQHLTIMRVEGEHHEIWERSMNILGQGGKNYSTSDAIAVVIRPDAAGLPFMAPQTEK
jgi:hypothetical protein